MKYNTKAVILGNNYYMGLSTIRCLGIHGIPTVAMDYSEENRYGAKSKYVSEKLIVPHYKNEPDKFIQALIDYAKDEKTKPVLIPCHDSYVEVIDEYLEEITQYYLIPQQIQGIYTTVMNKETLHNLAIKHGVKVPETVRIDDKDFYAKVENEIRFPCLVKPVDSPAFVMKFRKKLFKVHSMSELEEALQLANQSNLEVIVQRIIPGFDDHMYTFDAYVDQSGKVSHWMTCQKLRQYPINYGASVYTIQKHLPKLYDIGAPFLEDIGFKGFAEIEFKKDEKTGVFYLIEINARITNLNSMLYKAGLNFPYITYKELIGEALPPKAIKKTTNIAFWYAYEDMLAIKDYVRSKQLSIINVFKTFFRPKAYAVWSWKDPKPGISYLSNMFNKLLKRLFKR